MKKYRLAGILAFLSLCLTASAQRFFNLTYDETSVDSVLPRFTYSIPLAEDYRDSIYTSSILYPEFVDMTALDVQHYRELSSDSLPALPHITQRVVMDRGRGMLNVQFCPLVYRDGKYQILVSFMLRVDAKAVNRTARRAARRAPGAGGSRYAAHSVLASGRWVKIRVPSSGVYEVSAALARKAGFSDLSKVKVYGYGGNLQNERLDGNELQALDDLKEVATCTVNGRRLFYANGPVTWSSNTTTRRTRNPYSDYGYYFLTSDEAEPLTVDSTAFLNSFYPSTNDYHSLYEVDGYSWYNGGRNLFDTEPIANGHTKRVVLTNTSHSSSGKLSVNLTAGSRTEAQVMVNDSVLGTLYIYLGEYDKGNERAATYALNNLHTTDTVKIKVVSGGPARLDYVQMAWERPRPAPNLRGAFPSPEYVYAITNQDHHADPEADMVMIIPTSQKLKAQAQRLAAFHEKHDTLRVNIVPADELYNEFSSGTPDANAYRRYLKMLYDRAGHGGRAPRYLLLFGDCVWDNRLRTADCSSLNADDLLLCYESENSFNTVECYVDDGFYGLLDDGEGTNPQSADMLDLAVGRFPVRTEAEARVLVDKTIGYVSNKNAGAWQNVLMFMGDDGNNNMHMDDANKAADDIAARYPGYQIKKVMWDAYTQEMSSTGRSYPEVSSIVKQQQRNGALIMDYAGHGRPDQISHEIVLKLTDFKGFTNKNLPLWITASCDIMPFDGIEENIGEAAMLNQAGGAVAFFGTTRTVWANYNKVINMAFLRLVLGQDGGKPMTMGEAQRQAKNLMITAGQDLTTNKLQYSLLGDPAIALNQPQMKVVVDSINGQAVGSTPITLKAASVARVSGHIENVTRFNGTMTAVVLDSKELVTCRQNASADADSSFQFYNRSKAIYSGSDSVVAGKFSLRFAVPVDLNYSGDTGEMNIYAVNNEHTLTAHGYTDNFVLGGSAALTDTVGPKIFCYLNTPDFVSGDRVNTTPYFVAQISDDDGINATGNGVGHDMQLIIDGKATQTYTLNDNFAYDFGTYTSGSVGFTLPMLEPGPHKLMFRAWDTMNNPSTVQLDFNVVKGLKPTIYNVSATRNPASTSTTFIISHNFGGSNVDVILDVYDLSGRLLWTHSESGPSTTGTYSVDWNLTQNNGYRVPTGVYLYRARVSCDGSGAASKARKLVIISNN
ncbi:MAG: type IX secretion system sortase PorU [Prevotella sp.]